MRPVLLLLLPLLPLLSLLLPSLEVASFDEGAGVGELVARDDCAAKDD